MALLARSTSAGGDLKHLQKVAQIAGDFYAGEDLDAVSFCRIAADGLVYMSDGTASDALARFNGVTPHAVKSGQAVTLYRAGARFGYGTGLTPGALYYIAATKGRLDTAATTGGLVAVAEAINTTDIQVIVHRAGA